MKKTSKATQKEENPVAFVAKHTSKLEAVAGTFVILDGEISTAQLRLGVLPKKQLQVDTMRAVERKSSPLPELTSSKANVLDRASGRSLVNEADPSCQIGEDKRVSTEVRTSFF